jgi:hypothetical protein
MEATMPGKSPSIDYDRGGHNPRPSKSTPRKQVGPMPTSGDDKKGKDSDQKKIHEKAREE